MKTTFKVELIDGQSREVSAYAYTVREPGDLLFLDYEGFAIVCYAPGQWFSVEQVTKCN